MRLILNRLPLVFLICFAGVIAALFAAACAADSPEYTWADVQEIGRTEALRSAAFVLTDHHSGIIWDAAQLEVPLAYTPLNQINHLQPLLPYPGLDPRQWQTAPAEADTYHLIWLNQNGRLYSALLNAEGQTMRGPIELSLSASSFIALPYAENRVFTAWIADNNLFAANIDHLGRPRSVINPLLEDVAIIAGAADQESNLHLAWLESNSLGIWAINYRTTSPDNIRVEPFETLLTFQIAPNEIITSFTMGLDQTHGYLFWGLSSADQPDLERVYTLSFPLDQPADVYFTELALPVQFEPNRHLPESEFALGPVAELPAESGTRAALRWPRPPVRQHTILPLAITLRTDEMWVPAVVYYQAGIALGYQIIASIPANAAPPTLAIDSGGDLHLAWVGLQGAIPTLFVASTGNPRD